MSLSVFLIFPDDDTKILSLCESCETLIAFLSDISSILSKASKTIKFYYDSQNIELFSQKNKSIISGKYQTRLHSKACVGPNITKCARGGKKARCRKRLLAL